MLSEKVALKYPSSSFDYFIADLARGEDTENFFASFKQLLRLLFEDVVAKPECLRSQQQLLAIVQVMQKLA